MRRAYWNIFILGFTSMAFSVSCLPIGDDDDDTTMPGDDDTTMPGDDDDTQPMDQDFLIRIENVSDQAGFSSPFAPGVWAGVSGSDALFTPGAPDAGTGLEALAEDGDPGMLAASLADMDHVLSSGVFNTPVGGDGPGPLLPGAAYEFVVSASTDVEGLVFATMLVQSNDWFIAPATAGVVLFDADGMPLPERDITDELFLWNAGTEVDEPVALGPNQPLRQAGPNSGPAEGVVRPFTHNTRALPLAYSIVDVSVSTGEGNAFMFTLSNVSEAMGQISTPLAPVFYALHNGTGGFFEDGLMASSGLESLAEDGSPDGLISMFDGATGYGEVGAAAEPEQAPGSPSPILPGQSYTFSVTPVAGTSFLTFGTMVVQSNDAFIAPVGAGIQLLDADGQLRPAAEVEAEIAMKLAVWDAGTEANEVPGAGSNQAPRQTGPNTGPADPTNHVRRYDDATNDLAGSGAAGFVGLTIVNGANAGDFEIEYTNMSGQTAYPGLSTPVVWYLHDGGYPLFTEGQPAPAALESLAEDGDASMVLSALAEHSEIDSGLWSVPDQTAEAGPLANGQSYKATLTVSAEKRYLNLAAMIVPSNDTFVSLGSMGIPLLDEAGAARSDLDIAADIATAFYAWDAGSEANQSGAAGPDQAPHQAAAGAGSPEGNGTVQLADQSASPAPMVRDLVQVTITPLQ